MGTEGHQSCCKASQRDIQFFHTVTPTESPNIMGLKGIHSPKALHCHGSCSYYPWCGKVEQNKGMVINHLWTMHYYLGLICVLCLDFFVTGMDTMRWHMPSCKSIATEDKDWEEEE